MLEFALIKDEFNIKTTARKHQVADIVFGTPEVACV